MDIGSATTEIPKNRIRIQPIFPQKSNSAGAITYAAKAMRAARIRIIQTKEFTTIKPCLPTTLTKVIVSLGLWFKFASMRVCLRRGLVATGIRRIPPRTFKGFGGSLHPTRMGWKSLVSPHLQQAQRQTRHDRSPSRKGAGLKAQSSPVPSA